MGVAEPSDDTHLARLTEEGVWPVPGGWRIVGVGAPAAAGSCAWLLSPASDNKDPLKATPSAVGSARPHSLSPL